MRISIHQQRLAMFSRDADTFWSRNVSWLGMLNEFMDFPDDAYYQWDGDDYIMPVMRLKRVYLNRLRRRLLKVFRQGKSLSTIQRDYWRKKNDESMAAHIAYHRGRNEA